MKLDIVNSSPPVVSWTLIRKTQKRVEGRRVCPDYLPVETEWHQSYDIPSQQKLIFRQDFGQNSTHSLPPEKAIDPRGPRQEKRCHAAGCAPSLYQGRNWMLPLYPSVRQRADDIWDSHIAFGMPL